MSYKVYKKHVNKYGKKTSSGVPTTNHTQSVYLFSGRSITPDKKPLIGVKKNSNIYGRVSGASTDRTHNLNRNMSLTAISGSGMNHSQSRNSSKKERMSTLKSKDSISSKSSYNHHTSNTKASSKTFRRSTGEDTEKEMKLMETVKLLKTENK